MPEGPEIKTVARTLAEKIVGRELGPLWHSQYRLRKSVDYHAIRQFENMIVDEVSCYGKVLFIDTDRRPALMVQLGMTGQIMVVPTNNPLAPHTHLRWTLKNTDQELRYVDPRRFGLFDACNEENKQDIIGKLGPDPFRMTQHDHEPLIKAMKRSARNIKELLLDQSVIAGVGNIYASEALFLAQIDPRRKASDIEHHEYRKLVLAVIEVLDLAFTNCGTTFSNYVDGSGNQGHNLGFLKVFQRDGQPCTVSKTKIERIKQGGRSTFYCPKCQR